MVDLIKKKKTEKTSSLFNLKSILKKCHALFFELVRNTNFFQVFVLRRTLDWFQEFLIVNTFVRRGIKEAIWERVEQPSFNRKGGFRFSLSNTWDRVLRRFPRRLSRDPSGSRNLQH